MARSDCGDLLTDLDTVQRGFSTEPDKLSSSSGMTLLNVCWDIGSPLYSTKRGDNHADLVVAGDHPEAS